MEQPELRYADGPSVEAEVHIAAPPEAVWALVSDIALPARFSSELQGADWVGDATGPCVGAQFLGHNRHPAVGKWTTTCTITTYEPTRTYGWVVGDVAHPSAQWRFDLAAADGGTRLTQWMRMGPARSGINPAIDAMPDKESKILHRRLAEHRLNMEANLHGIKALLEA